MHSSNRDKHGGRANGINSNRRDSSDPTICREPRTSVATLCRIIPPPNSRLISKTNLIHPCILFHSFFFFLQKSLTFYKSGIILKLGVISKVSFFFFSFFNFVDVFCESFSLLRAMISAIKWRQNGGKQGRGHSRGTGIVRFFKRRAHRWNFYWMEFLDASRQESSYEHEGRLFSSREYNCI